MAGNKANPGASRTSSDAARALKLHAPRLVVSGAAFRVGWRVLLVAPFFSALEIHVPQRSETAEREYNCHACNAHARSEVMDPPKRARGDDKDCEKLDC